MVVVVVVAVVFTGSRFLESLSLNISSLSSNLLAGLKKSLIFACFLPSTMPGSTESLPKFGSPCIDASMAKLLGSDRASKVMSSAVVSKTILANVAANVEDDAVSLSPSAAAAAVVATEVVDGHEEGESSISGIRTSSAIWRI